MAGLRVPLPTLHRILAGIHARLGVDMDRYSFIVEDFHSVFLAGFSGDATGACRRTALDSGSV